jgi:hypothetical protein
MFIYLINYVLKNTINLSLFITKTYRNSGSEASVQSRVIKKTKLHWSIFREPILPTTTVRLVELSLFLIFGCNILTCLSPHLLYSRITNSLMMSILLYSLSLLISLVHVVVREFIL